MTEKTENNSGLTISGKFEMLPVEALSLLGKKIRTPDGRVEKIDGDDLVWWMFFFTFLHQKTPCYQTRKTISDRFDCDERTVSRRTARLEELGLLTIEKRKGTSSIYTATSVEQFLLMKTDQKVTPKEESNGDKTNKKPATVASASATNDPEQQPSVSWSAGDSSDDVPAHDDPSLSDLPEANPFTGVDAVNSSETPQRADIFDLKLWREGGPSAFGFMEYGKEHGETDVDRVVALIDQHYFEALKQITIFDKDGVVTEEFINALSGDDAPKRNNDGTLKKYGFAYAMAQAYQAHREGKSEEEIQRSIPVWIEAALPEYIPVHLLPKEHRAEPKPEPVHDLSNEPIPF